MSRPCVSDVTTVTSSVTSTIAKCPHYTYCLGISSWTSLSGVIYLDLFSVFNVLYNVFILCCAASCIFNILSTIRSFQSVNISWRWEEIHNRRRWVTTATSIDNVTIAPYDTKSSTDRASPGVRRPTDWDRVGHSYFGHSHRRRLIAVLRQPYDELLSDTLGFVNIADKTARGFVVVLASLAWWVGACAVQPWRASSRTADRC